MSDPSPTIAVSPLTAAEAADAFGLAALALPGLTAPRWRQLVRRWSGSGAAGALIARDSAGRVVGFAPFEVRTGLCCERALWVERVVAVSLVDTAPALRALASALTDAARERRCRRLKIETSASDGALRRALRRGPGVARSTLVQTIL